MGRHFDRSHALVRSIGARGGVFLNIPVPTAVGWRGVRGSAGRRAHASLLRTLAAPRGRGRARARATPTPASAPAAAATPSLLRRVIRIVTAIISALRVSLISAWASRSNKTNKRTQRECGDGIFGGGANVCRGHGCDYGCWWMDGLNDGRNGAWMMMRRQVQRRSLKGRLHVRGELLIPRCSRCRCIPTGSESQTL